MTNTQAVWFQYVKKKNLNLYDIRIKAEDVQIANMLSLPCLPLGHGCLSTPGLDMHG